MKAFIDTLIPWGVLLAQVLLLLAVLFHRHRFVRPWLKRNSMRIIFVVSFLATLASLFYSKIMMYTPCELCWYQRILMYPLVIISGFSLLKASKQVKQIILSMASIGAFISAYQYFTQITDTSTFCGIGATDCSAKIVFTFGYMSIPLMALTAFVIVIFVTLLSASKKRKSSRLARAK